MTTTSTSTSEKKRRPRWWWRKKRKEALLAEEAQLRAEEEARAKAEAEERERARAEWDSPSPRVNSYGVKVLDPSTRKMGYDRDRYRDVPDDEYDEYDDNQGTYGGGQRGGGGEPSNPGPSQGNSTSRRAVAERARREMFGMPDSPPPLAPPRGGGGGGEYDDEDGGWGDVGEHGDGDPEKQQLRQDLSKTLFELLELKQEFYELLYERDRLLENPRVVELEAELEEARDERNLALLERDMFRDMLNRHRCDGGYASVRVEKLDDESHTLVLRRRGDSDDEWDSRDSHEEDGGGEGQDGMGGGVESSGVTTGVPLLNGPVVEPGTESMVESLSKMVQDLMDEKISVKQEWYALDEQYQRSEAEVERLLYEMARMETELDQQQLELDRTRLLVSKDVESVEEQNEDLVTEVNRLLKVKHILCMRVQELEQTFKFHNDVPIVESIDYPLVQTPDPKAWLHLRDYGSDALLKEFADTDGIGGSPGHAMRPQLPAPRVEAAVRAAYTTYIPGGGSYAELDASGLYLSQRLPPKKPGKPARIVPSETPYPPPNAPPHPPPFLSLKQLEDAGFVDSISSADLVDAGETIYFRNQATTS